MSDPVLHAFFRAQLAQGRALAAASDLLELQPDAGEAPSRYIVRFTCEGLVRLSDGRIVRGNCFDVGVQFSEDYLRRVDPLCVATMLWPPFVWAPNVNAFAICVGHLPPGTGLVDILFQVFDIITWNRFSAHDGLNPAACEFARNNREIFPIDRRPLKRRVEGGAR